MSLRDLNLDPESRGLDVILRADRGWTWSIFCACLSILHGSISIPWLLRGSLEGMMSLIFCVIFALASLFLFFLRRELAILPARKRIAIRRCIGRFCYERLVPFSAIRNVRLTLPSHGDVLLELLCDGEEIICPLTDVPRQQALYLAMTLNVPLIKLLGSPQDEAPSKRASNTLDQTRPLA